LAHIETVTTFARRTRSWEFYSFKDRNLTGIQNDTGNVNQTNSGRTSIIRDTNTSAGYGQIVKSGGLKPELPYHYVKSVTSGWYYVGTYVQLGDYGSYLSWKYRTGNANTSGHEDSYTADSLAFAAQDRQLNNKILSNIKNQKVNLAQAVGERHQVIRMVGDTAIKIAGALSALKKGNIGAAARSLGCAPPGRYARQRANGTRPGKFSGADFVTRSWLELQYGWKPLLQDIYGLAETMATRGPRANIQRVTASVTKKFNQQNAGFYSPDRKATWTSNHDVTRTRRKTVFFTANAETKPLAELGLTNPAMVAWELMPWSFVIDWFLPVGNWISSWDATLGASFVQGSNSTSLKVVSTNITVNAGYNSEYYTSQQINSSFSFDRYVDLNFPSVSLPEWKNPLSTVHALNGLSLLYQRFRK
jgi:hypothetical protein